MPSGTLTFADGETTKTIDVSVTDDGDAEGDETVNVALSNPTNGATLGTPATAVLTIRNDDGPFGVPPPCAAAPASFGAIWLLGLALFRSRRYH